MTYIKAMLLSILAILAPIKATMVTTGVLIILDLILGLLAALKTGDKITSAALRRTVSKMIAYQVAIISGFIFEKYLLPDMIPATKLIASVIGLVEIKSILENADIINGESVFGKLIKKLGSEND